MSGQSVRGIFDALGNERMASQFQSPRCRGSRCGDGDFGRRSSPHRSVSIPSVSGQSVRATARAGMSGRGSEYVSIPSVSGQSVREILCSILDGFAGVEFQSPRCRGIRCGYRILRGRRDSTRILFQSPRCRGSRVRGKQGIVASGTRVIAFQSPRCRGSRCGAMYGARLERAEIGVEFQSPRCRGSRCGCGTSSPEPGVSRYTSFNPLGVGAVGAGRESQRRAWAQHAGFQSPRCRGSRCGPRETIVVTRHPALVFQSPRCRGSRCGSVFFAYEVRSTESFNPLGVGAVGAGPPDGETYRRSEVAYLFQSPRCRGSRCGFR